MYFGEYRETTQYTDSRIVKALMDGTQMVTIILEGTINSPTGLALDRAGDVIAFSKTDLTSVFI